MRLALDVRAAAASREAQICAHISLHHTLHVTPAYCRRVG